MPAAVLEPATQTDDLDDQEGIEAADRLGSPERMDIDASSIDEAAAGDIDRELAEEAGSFRSKAESRSHCCHVKQ